MVDFKTGELVKQIPIDIGKRHFKILEGVLLDNDEKYRSGDRVVVDHARDSIVTELRARGVIVELRKPYVPIENVRLDMKNKNPQECWDLYMLTYGDTSLNQAFQDVIQHEDVSKCLTEDCVLHDSIHIDFTEMVIHNIGPFSGTHTVDFTTGITLVTGKYNGKTGTDSNGVGKSLYTAGAFLWVCSGKTDPRCWARGMTKAIITSGKDTAHVILRGKANGVQFTITRNMTHGRHELHFLMEGRDCGHNTID